MALTKTITYKGLKVSDAYHRIAILSILDSRGKKNNPIKVCRVVIEIRSSKSDPVLKKIVLQFSPDLSLPLHEQAYDVLKKIESIQNEDFNYIDAKDC